MKRCAVGLSLLVALLSAPARADEPKWVLLDDFEGQARLWSAESGLAAGVRLSAARAHQGRRSLAITLGKQRPDMIRATWQADVSDLRFKPTSRLRFWFHGSRLAQQPHGGLILVESGGRQGGGDAHWLLDIPGAIYREERWQLVELGPFSAATQPDWSVDANGQLDCGRISRLLFVAQQEATPDLTQPFTGYLDDLEATDVSEVKPVVKPATNQSTPAQIRPQLRGFVDRERAHPAQVTFADLSDWQVHLYGGMEATLERSAEEPLFERYSAKLTYRSPDGGGWLACRPKTPIPLPGSFNAVQTWVFGNNWDWVPDPATPQVDLAVTLRDATGQEHRLAVGRVNFKFWGLFHKLILADPGRDLGHLAWGGAADGVIHPPAVFTGLEVRGAGNQQPRVLYFDSVAAYLEGPQIPKFQPVPARLPFPTTPDTILPDAGPGTVALAQDGEQWRWTCRAGDETVEYLYRPVTGTLADLVVRQGEVGFKPADGAGLTWTTGGESYEPADQRVVRRLLTCRRDGDAVRTRWRLSVGDRSIDYYLTLRAKGRSLVHEWRCAVPESTGLSLGRATGLTDGRLFMVPYFTVAGAGGAGILYDRGLYASHLLDWYVTDASHFYGGAVRVSEHEIGYNGGCGYTPLTNGQRNPLHERGVLTVSRRFEAVLPTIPNPPSPLTPVLREYMYTHLGGTAPNRFDVWLEQFRRYRRYGIDKLIVTQHEDSWTQGADVGQGPEEYTMTASGPPDAGGDATMLRYYRGLRELGYYVGPYNNYTDYSPLGKSFVEENVTRLPDGEWQRVWPPCFNIRPLKAAEMQAHWAPAQHAKFGVNAQYCDVHTCIPPWADVDYQAGTPGAGKLRTTFEAYGRLLMNNRAAYGGPSFSEGTHHVFYAGLVDGSYAQMGLPNPHQQPLLVDFDLRQLHTQGADLSMLPGAYWTGDEYDGMAATIAYGHAGFFPVAGLAQSCRYYYLMGALQREYVQVPVTDIGYWDGARYLGVSEALPRDVPRRGQLKVTYRTGLTVWVNRHQAPWDVSAEQPGLPLTQHGWLAARGREFRTWSTRLDGRRVSYARCPAYTFADAGGQWHDFGDLATDGEVCLRRDAPGGPRLIAIAAATKVALAADAQVTRVLASDEAGQPLGEVEVSRDGGRLVFATLKGAVNYDLR